MVHCLPTAGAARQAAPTIALQKSRWIEKLALLKPVAAIRCDNAE
jgi:hypothetical protein